MKHDLTKSKFTLHQWFRQTWFYGLKMRLDLGMFVVILSVIVSGEFVGRKKMTFTTIDAA